MMHAFAASGASFLVAVLWFDLMFDVQTRRQAGDTLPSEILASISAYYRRVTTNARPMNVVIPAVMALTLIALGAEIVQGATPSWTGWLSLGLAASAIGLALARTVRNARRLGQANDPPAAQTTLARRIYRDHQVCLIAVLAVVVLQLLGAT